MRLIVLVLILVAMSVPVTAQDTYVTIDSVDGLTPSGDLRPDVPLTFHVRLHNGSSCHFNITHGFRIYSPDGATWSYGDPAGEIVNGINNQFLFPNTYFLPTNIDGIASDTIGFTAVGFGPDQMHDGFDGYPVRLHLEVDSPQAGKTICIDSTFFPPNGTWKWAATEGDCGQFPPAWDGPHCWTIAASCCVSVRGNADYSADNVIDVGDVTCIASWLFRGGPPPTCMPTANADADLTGAVDIGDINHLIGYLFLGTQELYDCGQHTSQ